MALANRGADVEVEMDPKGESLVKGTNFAGNKNFGIFSIRTQMEKILLVVAAILLILCIVFIALLAKETADNDSSKASTTGGREAQTTAEPNQTTSKPTAMPSPKPTTKPSGKYVYSDEAQRIKFPDFLKRVQDTYYEYNRDQFAWQSHKNVAEITDDLKTRSVP
ncbi:uncharacterized protein LOC114535063 [Dendronephthya gigantea]|uniref:uncharacterized protein LOC114535063 n=1 Tax=Dendronephthya gigantea TaxID=151771 RepID=UPI00106A8E4B|nr:uncharacterized protein LOC114535063 [Dendronephthya gigantea]